LDPRFQFHELIQTGTEMLFDEPLDIYDGTVLFGIQIRFTEFILDESVKVSGRSPAPAVLVVLA